MFTQWHAHAHYKQNIILDKDTIGDICSCERLYSLCKMVLIMYYIFFFFSSVQNGVCVRKISHETNKTSLNRATKFN